MFDIGPGETNEDNFHEGNNIDADPAFVSLGYWDEGWVAGDYHLSEGSPCVNMGDNGAPDLPDEDFDEEARIQNDIVTAINNETYTD